MSREVGFVLSVRVIGKNCSVWKENEVKRIPPPTGCLLFFFFGIPDKELVGTAGGNWDQSI